MIRLRADSTENLLSPEDIQILKTSFQTGAAAEALDFSLSSFIPVESLKSSLTSISYSTGFWDDIPNLKFLAIKLFYKLVREYPDLDVNQNLDTSVTYWTRQTSPILSKILADNIQRG